MNKTLKLCPFCNGEAFINIEGRDKHWVECRECGSESDCYETEAEAIAAWNARTERTCEWILEHSGTLYDKWRCSKCGYLYVSSRCDAGATDFDPNYCPNCGRKVKKAVER